MTFQTQAQDRVQVWGVVYDAKRHQPIENVTVSINGKLTATNTEGKYSFSDLPRGVFVVKISCIGYETLIKEVDLRTKSSLLLDANLKESNELLEEIVVTGTRTQKTLRNTPILTKVISKKEITQIGGNTAFDVLESLIPGILFSPDAHGNNMIINGLDANYVLVLVDGQRMVGEVRGDINLDRLSASDIEKIEILSGSSSVLYGSNAIGGVINIITKQSKHRVEGEASVRYASFNNQKIHLCLGTKQKNINLRINGFYNISDGYDLTPETPEVFTASPYIDYSIGAKIICKVDKNIDFISDGTYFKHETFNPQKSLKSIHRLTKNYNVGTKLIAKINTNHNVSLGFNTDIYNAFSVYEKLNDSAAKYSDYQYATFNLIDEVKISEEFDVIGGVELNLEDIFSAHLFGVDVSQKEKEKFSNDFNFFAQGDLKPIKNLELVGGLRYTSHKAFGSHTTPKLSTMYRLSDYLKFRGTIAWGYKLPSLKQLYYNFDHSGMFWIYGNSNLKSENSRYSSLSVEYTSHRFNTSANLYLNQIDDKIDMIATNNTITDKMEFNHYNINAVKIKGVEIDMNWQLSNIKMKLGYVFSDAIDQSTGLQIYGNSNHTATTMLTYFTNHEKYPLSISLSGRGVSSRLYQTKKKDKNNKEIVLKEKTDPYTMWKFVYIQQIAIRNRIKSDLKLGVDNIFDYSNLEKSSVLNPGRTFWAGISMKF